ncbi:MAG TPA: hypothetical protein VMB21_00760, partial [Candidatus Limnocylindria bacterium]|nr:hypothetical protein [Candidatus Limnocylindria bacterium]
MKRVGVFLGILCLGIILFAVLRLQPAEPPSIVFGLLSPTWPGQENEPRDELCRQGAAVVPSLVSAVEYRSLTESAMWRWLVAKVPIAIAQ